MLMKEVFTGIRKPGRDVALEERGPDVLFPATSFQPLSADSERDTP
jgi:hypothetical protein